MYIEPNTNIRILKNVRLDNTYKNTIWFSSKTEQVDYFIGKQKYNLVNYTYQRVQKGVARVGINANNLYDCNYMMFQNTSFGNKWFYAFITGVEYINNSMSEIYFEIDTLQTWFYDCTLLSSFIVREHSVTDNVGENLVPEDVELGDYVSDDFDGTGHIRDYKIVVACTKDADGNHIDGGLYGRIYSGTVLNVFNTAQEVNEYIRSIELTPEAIVSIFMIPSDFITDIAEPPKSYTITKTKQLENIGGYVPKNKKLFTSPYNLLYVTNLEGMSANFAYEYFSDESCTFTLAGDFSPNPMVVLYPENYKGVPQNIDEKMVISGFPQCSWNTSSYKQWLARNASNVVGALWDGGTSSTRRGVTGAVGRTVETAISAVTTSMTMPRQAHGIAGNSSQVALGIKDFAFMHKHIRPEFAKIIDEYFNAYGYATHRVKVPNISSRPHWNYVETIGCNISGEAPASEISKIKDIFNKGVTFWKNGDNIGNYSLDNTP